MRTYEKTPGSRAYHNFTEEQAAEAVRAVQDGMSKKQASRVCKIPRSTLTSRCLGRHTKPQGHPTILSSEEEAIIARTLGVVAYWGFPLTKADIKQIVKKFLDKKGIVIPILKDNLPGDDMVALFIQRNNLSVRMASNIKRSRASVDQYDVNKFFDNIKPALLESTGDHIYNYDETNITDDPGARKFIVPRNCKRVERVQNFSRTAISIMVCGTASGELLPPMVVYKAYNLYENLCVGGPTGTVYRNSPSGWFDANLFEIWFTKILVPHIQRTRQPGMRVVVVGDNLASHFAPNVIRIAQEEDIYLTPFPPNATHLIQPLDVAVFAPMKRTWLVFLDTW
ncbi:jerky protein homolog-like [Anoplophora glabripennis]|uniref:jerky protein homolog-like n=1 Tax=Anoplophora glabripennis TaxID=217634 RepID=UPI000873C6B7|nr:jerky protein homolog-like [Anoplophora glabripennis]